jgi:hypothetical protein
MQNTTTVCANSGEHIIGHPVGKTKRNVAGLDDFMAYTIACVGKKLRCENVFGMDMRSYYACLSEEGLSSMVMV